MDTATPVSLPPESVRPRLSLGAALRFWLKLGFISFGGPAGQIAIMHTELVERRRWISERRFLHALNYCMLLPGPEAQQLATYIGWLLHRSWGGIIAGGLFVLPSLLVLTALSWIYAAYGSLPAVAGLFYGIKPAVTAIVLHAAHRIGSRALKNPALWAIPMAALTALYGWQGAYTQMGWFFTKAALLTFGGAYAVLPYIYQGAVDHHAWLTAAQMIDGLALGETTPGPLIMVVAFVGFVAGYFHELLGPGNLFLAGALGATLVTWFTFLPSFLFILGGGPLVEATKEDLKFTAPLTAITTAVVGVILNLALFFGYHVLWPRGWSGRFDWISALIALAAAIALFRYRRGVIQVIAGCAATGLLVTLAR